MKREFALAVAVGAGSFITVKVDAASIRVAGYIDAHAGYGSNPFFSLTDKQSNPSVGTTANVALTRLTSRSRTELSGTANFEHYLKEYGTIQNYSATLRHNQQLSQFLSITGYGTYENAINPPASYSTKSSDLLPETDLLTVGQRSHRISGGIDTTWEPDQKNLFQAGINGSHATFSGGNANAYNQYGLSLGYLRTVNAHTKIGIQGGVSQVISTSNPRSRSYSSGLQLIQQLNATWKFEGGVSFLLQSISGSFFKTFGFNGSLCGTYPRITICFMGSRMSAASGLGGLRTDTQGGGRINYKMTPRSSLNATVTYDVSTSAAGVIPAQKYYDAALEYRHDIGPNLQAGVSARGQRRDYGTLFSPTGNKVNSYSGTFNIVWKFGRRS